MKAIHWFYLGLGIDGVVLLYAIFDMISDALKGYSGSNNMAMLTAVLIFTALIAAAFALKWAGKILFANILLWIPAVPIFAYGLMILAFIIFRPDLK